MSAANKSQVASRSLALTGFVGILAWLSVVIGIGSVHVVSSPWCAPTSACAPTFWPRLLLAAGGGIGAFAVIGYGILNFWDRPRLTWFALAGVMLAAATGAWFVPVVRA